MVEMKKLKGSPKKKVIKINTNQSIIEEKFNHLIYFF